jgi:hypothetical protein
LERVKGRTSACKASSSLKKGKKVQFIVNAKARKSTIQNKSKESNRAMLKQEKWL